MSHGAAGPDGEAEVGQRGDKVEEGEERGRREVVRVASDEVGDAVGGERREELAEGRVGMEGLGGRTGYGFGEEREGWVVRVARWRRAVPDGAGGEDGGGRGGVTAEEANFGEIEVGHVEERERERPPKHGDERTNGHITAI